MGTMYPILSEGSGLWALWLTTHISGLFQRMARGPSSPHTAQWKYVRADALFPGSPQPIFCSRKAHSRAPRDQALARTEMLPCWASPACSRFPHSLTGFSEHFLHGAPAAESLSRNPSPGEAVIRELAGLVVLGARTRASVSGRIQVWLLINNNDSQTKLMVVETRQMIIFLSYNSSRDSELWHRGGFMESGPGFLPFCCSALPVVFAAFVLMTQDGNYAPSPHSGWQGWGRDEEVANPFPGMA